MYLLYCIFRCHTPTAPPPTTTTTISIVTNTQPTAPNTTNTTAADVSTSTTPGMVVCHYTKK